MLIGFAILGIALSALGTLVSGLLFFLSPLGPCFGFPFSGFVLFVASDDLSQIRFGKRSIVGRHSTVLALWLAAANILLGLCATAAILLTGDFGLVPLNP